MEWYSSHSIAKTSPHLTQCTQLTRDMVTLCLLCLLPVYGWSSFIKEKFWFCQIYYIVYWAKIYNGKVVDNNWLWYLKLCDMIFEKELYHVLCTFRQILWYIFWNVWKRWKSVNCDCQRLHLLTMRGIIHLNK